MLFSFFPHLQNANSALSPVSPIWSNLLGAGDELLSTELTSTCSELIGMCANCRDSHTCSSRAEQSRGRGKRVLAAASIPELLAASPGDAEFPDPR